ncbi:MAG: PepSY-associated TM helix domain-containing protein [Methylotenera sp.]|nr:PepSY domain-containing protein [Methylotenera sp.]
MRKAIVFLHRWVGLAVLLFIAVAAITGVIIAFDKELDHTLNDDWFYIQPGEQKMAMDQLVPIAEEVYPGKRVTFVRTNNESADRSMEFYLRTPATKNAEDKSIFDSEGKYHTVFVNPYSGKVLGSRENGVFGVDKRHIIPMIVKLHYTWYAGAFGKWVIGIAALLWLLDHFGAVYISFPNLKNWRKSFQFRWRTGGYKLNFDMHRSGSMWILPVLLALSLSSVYLNLNDQFKWVVNKFSPVTKTECACHVDPKANWIDKTASWDEAIKLAQQTRPDLTVGSISFLPDTRKFIVSLKGENDLTKEVGMTKVYVNAITGDLLHVHDRNLETAGDTFNAWQLPLHSGRVFGIVGQIIILLSGIVITIICVTGFIIYLKKLRAREAANPKEIASTKPETIGVLALLGRLKPLLRSRT